MNQDNLTDGLFDTDVAGASWQTPPDHNQTKKPPVLLYTVVFVIVLIIIIGFVLSRFSQPAQIIEDIQPTPTLEPTPEFSEIRNEIEEIQELIDNANPERQDLPPPVDMKLRLN